MFTGLIDHCGTILSVAREGDRAVLWMQSEFSDLKLGESVAIDGACLTVTEIKNDAFACEISPETLRLTTSNFYQPKQRVNLERALKLEDRLGGHFVTGHVDQMIVVAEIKTHQEFLDIKLKKISPQNRNYLIKKGSVSINGVSLTINELWDDGFNVMLIPHTLARTNLSDLREGSSVNVEFDMLAKLVVRR